MTDTLTTAPTEGTTVTIGFGVEVTTPDGRKQIEPRRGLLDAIQDVEAINRAFPGTAAVVYRDEEYGPWSVALFGNSFGTRFEWGDGHVEFGPAKNRAEADGAARIRNNSLHPGATARTVSRQVKYGQWSAFRLR